ncbi:LptA/OstA family protein [Floridanema aerugineum]|jgi:lipopolysaccharide export system protein LptA|uniref:LptA/OstA family protein n=1 Tax=Floridaenema aerugineum BLCC-F46 TaxID=3153654 RepID=A0ABV4WYL6_9CYAN
MMPAVKFPLYYLCRLGLTLLLPSMFMGAIALTTNNKISIAQTSPPTADSRPLTVRSDIQEADQKTGVITARGNVQLFYPARQIQATAAQAQYFSKERRIILTGNVYVLQNGNTIRGEQVVYLIDEGRFIAVPQANRQVESIYLVSDPNLTTEPTPPPKVPTTTTRPQSNTRPRGR